MKHLSITRRASLFFAGMFVLAVMLSHFVFTKYEASFRHHHETLAAQSVRAVSSELNLLLGEIRRATGLFVRHNSELLWQMSQNPDDEEIYGHIQRLLREHFPEHYSFTLANTEGQLLYDDLGEKVGPLCLRNIQQNITGEHVETIVVHPGPGEYHFDIMVPWVHEGVTRGIFFKSYRLDIIARLLEVGQATQHSLILTKQDDPGLIEITAVGGRDVVQRKRSDRFTESDVGRIAYSQRVEGTGWVLNDLYDENLMSDYQLRLWRPLIGAWIVVLFLTVVSLYFIRKSELGLRAMNDTLEYEVEERTIDLYATNTALEEEIIRRDKAEFRQRIFSRAADQSSEIIFITSINDILEYVNPRFVEATGYTAKEAIGQPSSMLNSGAMEQSFFDEVMETVLAKRSFIGIFINRKKDGELIYMDETVTPLLDDNGNIEHYIVTARDITEDKVNRDKLKYISDHDLLTGLYNRSYLENYINVLLSGSRSHTNPFALVYVDIDRFGAIREGLGHQHGDLLIKELSKRLILACKEGDIAARFSEDEFIVFVDAMSIADEVLPAVERLAKTIRKPVLIEGEQVHVTASMGITMHPQDAKTFGGLVNCAYSALKRAKKSGGNQYEFYQSGMSEQAALRIRLEHKLKDALDNNEIQFYYQPKIDISDGRLIGFESLARWENKDDGGTFIAPSIFIPVLEDSGLIIQLGQQAIFQVCKTLQDKILPINPDVKVAINLSGKQFSDHKLIDKISSYLDDYDLPADSLEFEVTESMLIESVNTAADVLTRLHDMGCQLSLDDFGTGYTSMQYLKSYPIDTIKIDRSFITDICTDEDDKILTETIINMSHNLGKRVIAEGVEDSEQLKLLRKMGCDEAQGYFIAKAMPSEALTDWLKSYNPSDYIN